MEAGSAWSDVPVGRGPRKMSRRGFLVFKGVVKPAVFPRQNQNEKLPGYDPEGRISLWKCCQVHRGVLGSLPVGFWGKLVVFKLSKLWLPKGAWEHQSNWGTRFSKWVAQLQVRLSLACFLIVLFPVYYHWNFCSIFAVCDSLHWAFSIVALSRVS